jgi:multiple sugar transport system permease protein
LSVTTLLVVFLFAFVWNWNETQITTTFLRGGLDLVPTRLSAFESLFSQYANTGAMSAGAAVGAEAGLEQQRINEAFRMSGTLIAITPLFVLYLIVQRQFIKGIENTGITGI